MEVIYQKNGFTELIRSLSYQYGQYQQTHTADEVKDDSEQYVTSFVSWPYSNSINNDQRCEFIHSRVKLIEERMAVEAESDGVSDDEKVKLSLTSMRKHLEDYRSNDAEGNEKPLLAHVFIGGRTKGSKGRKPGILEEFLLAKEKGHPVFLLGGFGGETMTAAKLYRQLREDGLRCCILKGQGNALMYPNPYSRIPGDIDVWVNDSREHITSFAKVHYGWKGEMHYHHLETTLDGVPIELHFLPCTMNNPVYNRRLQKWFRSNADLQCSNVVDLPDGAGEIAVPTVSFNVIYQLCHLYHHFFDEGIGMRQMIDYYFVIQNA